MDKALFLQGTRIVSFLCSIWRLINDFLRNFAGMKLMAIGLAAERVKA